MKKRFLSILTAMLTASAILPSLASFTGFNAAAAENIAYTEAQLRELIANDTAEITLGADITLTEPLEFPYVIGNIYKTLNMNGFTLGGDIISVSTQGLSVNGTLNADLIIDPNNIGGSSIHIGVSGGPFNGDISGDGYLEDCTIYGDVTGAFYISGSTAYGDISLQGDTVNSIDSSVIYGDVSGDAVIYPYNTFFYGDVNIECVADEPILTAAYTIGGDVCAKYITSSFYDEKLDEYYTTISKPDLSHSSITIDGWYYDNECTQDVDFSKIYSFPLSDYPYNITLYGLDTVSPVITGLEADKTYCGDVTFSVTDNVKVAKVSFGDEVLTPDENGLYTIKAGSGFGLVTATDTSGNTAYSDAFRVNDDHVYSWQSDDTYYWQECINCGDAKEKSEIPQIDSQIIGDDTIKRGENYIFSFEIPSGFEQALADADFGKSINDIIVFEIDGNTLRGAVFTAKDENNSDSFDVNVYLTLPSGYNLTVSKTVNIVDEEAVTTTTTTASVTTTTASDPSPKTGENSPLPAVIALFGLSLGAACVTICRKQKEEK